MAKLSEKPDHRVALVTGGSRGIGRAVCIALAAKGMHIAINYAGNETAAQETADACAEANPDIKTLLVQADVSDDTQVAAMTDQIKKTFGRIDVLVNNAGITRDNLIAMTNPTDFDAVIATNLRGTFLTMKHVSRLMMKQRFGRIINISSVVGLRGNAGQVTYAASKAGVIGMTKSIAKELASRNVTANAVAPGFVQTDMTAAMTDKAKEAASGQIPIGRLGTPEDIANAVAFFADDAASYITGQVLAVDGGMSM